MIDPATSGVQCELTITIPKLSTSWSSGSQIPQEETFEVFYSFVLSVRILEC
jgi:hypothetical protein